MKLSSAPSYLALRLTPQQTTNSSIPKPSIKSKLTSTSSTPLIDPNHKFIASSTLKRCSQIISCKTFLALRMSLLPFSHWILRQFLLFFTCSRNSPFPNTVQCRSTTSSFSLSEILEALTPPRRKTIICPFTAF